MKKILALPACLLALCTLAQKPVFKYALETEPKTNPDVLVMTHSSGSKTAFLLKNKKKIEYLLVGNDFKTISSFTNAQTPDKTIYGTMAIPAGYIYNGQKLYNFIYDEASRGGKTSPGRDVLLMDVIDFNGKQSELAAKHTFEPGEKVVNAFTYNNTYYMLSVPAGGDAISVCYIDSTLNKTVRSYPLSISSLISGYNTMLNLFRKAAVVYPDRENDLEAATASVKIMPQPGKIIISSDQKGMPTVLAVIDLYNNRLDLKKPAMEELCIKDDKNAAVNSTVMGNYLFTTVACKQKFELAVYNYTNGQLIKKHESVKDDGAPAVAIGGLNSESFSDGKKKNEKSLDNTGGLLKAMWNGNCGVKVNTNPQLQYVLTIGAYKTGKETVFPGAMRPEDAAADYAAPFAYTNYGPQLKFSTDYSTAWFRTVLTPDKFEKVKLSLKPGAADKLRDVLSMEEKLPQTVPVFVMGGTTYYPWYDGEAQQFTIRAVK